MILTGGISLLLMIGLGLFLYLSLHWELFKFIDTSLHYRADQMKNNLVLNGGQVYFDRKEISDRSLLEDDTAHLISPDGTIMDQLGKEYIPGMAGENLRNGFQTVRFWQPEGVSNTLELEIFRVFITPITDHGKTLAYLQVGREIDEIQEALNNLVKLLLISAPFIVGFSAVGGYWLAGKALAPIDKIRKAAASIQATDLHSRVEHTKHDEVGQLASTFNELLDRLEESFFRQRRFTADASHELRTPLSIIRGEVDVALERTRTQEEYIETLQSIGSEAQRMSRLVNELLLLARADTNELRLVCEKVDLADLLQLMAGHLQNQAEAAGVSLSVDVPAALTIAGDRDRLIQLFINLLENTFVHAPGSQATLTARTVGEQVEIIVADTGPGIPGEHLAHIFDRFYRVDPVRERASHGSGLGLAIAREIVLAHGGSIRIDSEVNRGTSVIVQLPL
jgi:heavy metal sensor kinase